MALVAFLTRAGRPVVFRTRRRNPSIRQRLRSSQKHLVAAKGLDPRDREGARRIVQAGKSTARGLARRHRLKKLRRTGGVVELAGRLT